MIISNICSESGILVINLFKRWRDRGYKWSLKTDDDDIPNSKMYKQSELNDLYTGPQIKAGEKFAQAYITISLSLMYSTGLPALYLITAISFMFAYWFNKIMFMRYY